MNLSRYLPSVGLFGLALYDFSTGNLDGAARSVLAALALLGVHVADYVTSQRLAQLERKADLG